jgi:imidazolonepropionase
MLITNATLATMVNSGEYGMIENGAISVQDDRVQWVGSSDNVPREFGGKDTSRDKIFDCGGKLVTPGLVDCHTHLVYAGNRAREFEQRLQGVSYEEIARSGGGILSTVSHTRAATLDELVTQSLPRLNRMLQEGVTTVEIKSGYGLDTDNEIKMLRAADKLSAITGIGIQKTFLGAHALPPEFADSKDEYISLVCREMLPAAFSESLVDAVDAFAENIAFSVEQVARVFDVAIDLNLPVKIHAEQLSHTGGARMAASRGAISVDHIEYLQADEVPGIANSGTVAVLLPGAFYFLKERKLPPIHTLKECRVPIAIATDCNPGSSPVTSLLLTMNMACTFFSLTPAEALSGVTLNAAKALGLQDDIGSLEAGKKADLVIWDTRDPAELSYNIGLNLCENVMKNGIWRTPAK